jgi:hypothetical protein
MNKIYSLKEVIQKNLIGADIPYLAYRIKESNELFVPVTENSIILDLDVNKVLKEIKNNPEIFPTCLIALNKQDKLTFQVCINEGLLPALLAVHIDQQTINKSKKKKELNKFRALAHKILMENTELKQAVKNIFNIKVE